jgi:DNA repair exonuclease SbcCD nuclease subunit
MPRLLHVSDLHLTQRPGERAYGLAVLDEIAAVAAEWRVDGVLLCGDIFDSVRDAEAMRTDLRATLARVPAPCLMIPGNHEDDGTGFRTLTALDFAPVELLAERPYCVRRLGEGGAAVEIVAIPHQGASVEAAEWDVPEKAARWRVAMAHGVVPGLCYTGPDVEDGGGALDAELFSRLRVDYAALGHVHDRRSVQQDGALIAYAGSARVWRSGEAGERGVVVVDLDEAGVQTTFVALASAGVYRGYDVPLSLEGMIIPPEVETWGTEDFIELRLSGVVDDENRVRIAEERLREAHGARVRRLEVRRGDVAVLAGIHTQPLAKRFLEELEARRPHAAEPDFAAKERVWLRARELGLVHIKRALEAQAP